MGNLTISEKELVWNRVKRIEFIQQRRMITCIVVLDNGFEIIESEHWYKGLEDPLRIHDILRQRIVQAMYQLNDYYLHEQQFKSESK